MNGLLGAQIILDVKVVNAVHVIQGFQLLHTLKVILQSRNITHAVSKSFIVPSRQTLMDQTYILRTLLHLIQFSLEVAELSTGPVVFLVTQ